MDRLFIPLLLFIIICTTKITFSNGNGYQQFLRICCRPSEILAQNHTCVNIPRPEEDSLKTSGSNFFINQEDIADFMNKLTIVFNISSPILSLPIWRNVLVGFPFCSTEPFEMIEHSTNSLELTNESLIVKGRRHGLIIADSIYDSDEFCIHNAMKLTSGDLFEADDDEFVFVAVVCQKKNWRTIFYTVLILISVLFLSFAIFYQIKKWKSFKAFHRWAQLACLLAMFIAFLCLGTLGIFKIFHFQNEYSDIICEILGNIIHFTFISALIWLSIINFDMWLFFACQRNSNNTGFNVLIKPLKKYIIFVCIGLGIPILFTWRKTDFDFMIKIEDMIHEYQNNTETENSTYVSPVEELCIFSKRLPYLYGPFGVFLIIDFVFLLATLISSRRRHVMCHSITSSNASIFTRQEYAKVPWRTFSILKKLLLLFGFICALEISCWAIVAFGNQYTTNKWIQLFFLVIDSIHFSQGIIIFMIFIWQPNICQKISGKFRIKNSNLGIDSAIMPAISGSTVTCTISRRNSQNPLANLNPGRSRQTTTNSREEFQEEMLTEFHI